jgi:hypothetical protein
MGRPEYFQPKCDDSTVEADVAPAAGPVDYSASLFIAGGVTFFSMRSLLFW